MGLALSERMPDEITLVWFQQRLIEQGRQEKLLAMLYERLTT